MTIEELKAEWESTFDYGNVSTGAELSILISDARYHRTKFALKYMDKFLAVVKASLKEREAQNKIGQTVVVELHDALDDLLEGKRWTAG